jgi:hypothetical protein
MTIFLQDFKQYLVSNDVLDAGACFVEFCPDIPKTSITLYKYDSSAPDDEISVQVMSKDIQPDAAILELENICKFLFGDDLENKTITLTINGNSCIFSLLTTPTFLKFEENSFYYVFNLLVTTGKI